MYVVMSLQGHLRSPTGFEKKWLKERIIQRQKRQIFFAPFLVLIYKASEYLPNLCSRCPYDDAIIRQ